MDTRLPAVSTAVLTVILGGCTTMADTLQPISSYEAMDCGQIKSELAAVDAAIHEAKEDEESSGGLGWGILGAMTLGYAAVNAGTPTQSASLQNTMTGMIEGGANRDQARSIDGSANEQMFQDRLRLLLKYGTLRDCT